MHAQGGALCDACALPVPQPGDVTRASTLDFADVAQQLATLTKQLAACKEKYNKVLETDAQSKSQGDEATSHESKERLDVFKEKMSTFLNAAEETLKTEDENLEECRSKFIDTVRFYQYSPKCGKLEDCEPKEFFSLWTLKEAKKLQGERKSLTQPKKEGGLKARLQKLSNSKK
ncbi:putative formin 1,2/cappuccino [Operophtera brumata]|uniref:Putative formin 1,2/cappuccino n=1 Tax=Operophtera brumata TaxID=104452 RepID=A0A0L7L4Y5_OPEBR|nr:putative formin 1,2/cappuccino [Operophtera brumata]